jgi:hypothetical protein
MSSFALFLSANRNSCVRGVLRAERMHEMPKHTGSDGASIVVVMAEDTVRVVLTAWREGRIDDAINKFDKRFVFKNYGMGLEYRDRTRLAEFFQKAREHYPNSLSMTRATFVEGSHIISEWTLQAVAPTLLFDGVSRKVPICVYGLSVVMIKNEKFVYWSAYCNIGTSRWAYIR